MVEAASALVGVSVAMVPAALRVTLAGTDVTPLLNKKVLPLTVLAVMASLKVAVTVVPMLMLVAPLVGVVELTVGGVVSEAAVVNDHTLSAARRPQAGRRSPLPVP